jgi:2-keto-4-pentenoate hydratase/2-oxohepta-3-ene-1,7-dioic acid hydratase in catechol pathway
LDASERRIAAPFRARASLGRYCVDRSIEPGDVILTGTPGGVGFKLDPQVFLTEGDTVAVEVPGLGRIESVVQEDK